SSARAVSRMIGSSRVSRSRFSARVSSSPLISGSIQSTSTKSGRVSASAARAARQSSASRTSKPARFRPKAIISRIGLSSSTIKTCLAGMWCRVPLLTRVYYRGTVLQIRDKPAREYDSSVTGGAGLHHLVTQIHGQRLLWIEQPSGLDLRHRQQRDLLCPRIESAHHPHVGRRQALRIDGEPCPR